MEVNMTDKYKKNSREMEGFLHQISQKNVEKER